jgi:phosphoglycolate phosphatase-like HAD superfamily hydrolase
MKHAVIFDIDGTLLDSSGADDRMYREAVAKILGDVRLRPTLADYDRITDTGILLHILEDNGLPEDPGIVTEVKNEFFSRLEAFVAESGPFTELPGAKSVLGRLRNSNSHHLAIATGGWRRSAEIKLRTAGFDIGTVPLATSDDAIDRTAIMEFALASIGEEVASVTYFGDGLWDRQACEILGWTFRAVGPVLAGISSYDDEFKIKSSSA